MKQNTFLKILRVLKKLKGPKLCDDMIMISALPIQLVTWWWKY